ncbi:hypothetical protein EPA93_10210 [Ktedonosporobacter rubrisoli]|uniref:Tetratricopeptide repeat protein n=1 Tax=Ktedonosporobacter rubrisoli TaxID=2509675 RepID=A0A4V0YYI7_KTERU|nr:hypothetical protein [Ktedonosporobacter rubrisoli]QBD76361.1 hypothetical protein EPA93_10210 [Ktedonosporobacter rubrisoli]
MWEEYNKVPKSPKRRYVLARLLDISFATFGLDALGGAGLSLEGVETNRVNVPAARARLQKFKQKNHTVGIGNMLENVMGVIYDIHDELPYATGQRQKELLLLLCDFQQFIAGIFRDHSQYDQSLTYQNKAYAIAKSLNDNEVKSLVLWRRGLTYHEQGDLVAASNDLSKALTFNSSSVLLEGGIRASLGHVLAHAATDKTDFLEAFKMLDKAGSLLDAAKKEPDPHFIKFNTEGYQLNRASSWIGVPAKMLRSSENALQEVSLVPVGVGRKRRYAYSSYLQARAWFDTGDYPLATKLAQDALNVASEIKSHVNVNRIHLLYVDLQATKYGKSQEVAALGADLLKAQHPEIFA